MRSRSILVRRLAVAGLACIPAALFASHRVVSPTSSSANDNVEITATITLSEPEIAQKLGADPGKGIALVEVRVSPKADQSSALVLTISSFSATTTGRDRNRSSLANWPEEVLSWLVRVRAEDGSLTSQRYGIPIGTGPTGQVQRMPGNSVGIGSSGGPGTLSTKANDKEAGNQALLSALKAKQLPDKVSKDEISGYLCFPLDGKHKLKNLAVLYRGPGGHLDLEFEH